MINPGDIHEGMTVRDLEGRKLGMVAHVGDTHFELGQGWPPQRDYVVHYHRVARVHGGDVFLTEAHAPVTPEEEQPGR
jgi:hypothetical protein